MEPVRWGIIGTARIGIDLVIPAMQQADNCEIVAIGSRNLETAKEAASKLGIPKAYGSYEELLADPDIEAVYNPLPNHLARSAGQSRPPRPASMCFAKSRSRWTPPRRKPCSTSAIAPAC